MTKVVKRFERYNLGYEVINVYETHWEWFIDRKRFSVGRCRNISDTIKTLTTEGFEEVV